MEESVLGDCASSLTLICSLLCRCHPPTPKVPQGWTKLAERITDLRYLSLPRVRGRTYTFLMPGQCGYVGAAHARRAGRAHPNQCSGPLSQCFTTKHHSLLQPTGTLSTSPLPSWGPHGGEKST